MLVGLRFLVDCVSLIYGAYQNQPNARTQFVFGLVLSCCSSTIFCRVRTKYGAIILICTRLRTTCPDHQTQLVGRNCACVSPCDSNTRSSLAEYGFTLFCRLTATDGFVFKRTMVDCTSATAHHGSHEDLCCGIGGEPGARIWF